ncbi:phosphotransferase [Planococcus salinus]|uniref:Aminoglycoside phosphotransferase domain-containing protein n=1 Tax=Planococcus salinus TaxID=1848460 RepID=A0A3M8P8N8_9BACL|nr:phosphotransferase [Planococcus salinus]RNF39620.1 hypothetical protein EEX84_09115 [Planococcus salinus]
MIKRLIAFNRVIATTVKKFKEHHVYLAPGKYVLDQNLKYIYRNDLDTKEFVNNVILKNNYKLNSSFSIKSIYKSFFVPRKNIVKGEVIDKSFMGTVYLLSNDLTEEKDVKIFDINTKEVLSICVERKALQKKINNYNYFSKYFRIPRVISYNLSEKICFEQLIISKPKNEWTELDYNKVISNIFQTYAQYYFQYAENNTVVYTCMRDKLTQIRNDGILKSLGDMLDLNISAELINSNLPLVNQHGDLWLYNILLSNNKENDIYFIDWEHSGEFIFLYDLFWWMQNEAVYNNDISYLRNYLDGKYDSEIIELFKAFNMIFDQTNRLEYFNIFMIEMLFNRVLSSNESTKLIVLNTYRALMQELISCKMVNISES